MNLIPSVIKLGTRVRFVPTANQEHTTGFRDLLLKEVTATITYINWAHRFYMAEYTVGKNGCKLRECFKF